jgi:hypothetical protein
MINAGLITAITSLIVAVTGLAALFIHVKGPKP